jgi:hypothetical protein
MEGFMIPKISPDDPAYDLSKRPMAEVWRRLVVEYREMAEKCPELKEYHTELADHIEARLGGSVSSKDNK